MLDDFSHVLPHGSFKVIQLCESIAICEALKDDQHGWGNAMNGKPAFFVYLGCQKDEVKGYVKTFNTFYRTEWCEVRKPKYLKGFSSEIKIRGMQRYSDTNAFGLDYLVESEQAKPKGCNYDELRSYTIFEYEIVMQSDEVHPEDGVPIDTQEWVSEFFNPQTEQSLNHHYEGWRKAGYHLTSYQLRQVKAKFDGDKFYRPIWQAAWVGDEDEF